MPRALNASGFWIYLWFWICQDFEYTRVLNVFLVLSMSRFWICKGYTGFGISLDRPEWFRNMPECARICVNMPNTVWMAFYVFVPILILFLLERVVTYFNEIYNKEWGYFLEEKNLILFYSSWCICFIFCFRLRIFASKFSFAVTFGGPRSGVHKSWLT